MSEKLHSSLTKKISQKTQWGRVALYALGLPLWVFASFFVASLAVVLSVQALDTLNMLPVATTDPTFNTAVAALTYILSIALVIGVPLVLFKNKTTWEDIGLTRLPSWMDILLTPAGYVVYALASGLLLSFVTAYLPVDLNQVQNVGFDNLTTRTQYLLAFVTLVILAPIAEEVLFRGYLYGKLKKYVPVWLAILVSSLLFGAVHGQWNVAFDTFAAGVVMCLLRDITGSLWPAIFLHMLKNGLAYYLLFINPSLIQSLGA